MSTSPILPGINLPHEVTFRLRHQIDHDLEDLLLEKFDAFLGGHGDIALLTVAVDTSAHDPRQAILKFVHTLFEMNVPVLGIEKDLVTASGIAKRCNESRQAVGNWIRGTRRSSFPLPYNSATQTWRWPDVNAWLKANNKEHDSDVEYLTLDDEKYVDYRIMPKCNAQQNNVRQASAVLTWTHLSIEVEDVEAEDDIQVVPA